MTRLIKDVFASNCHTFFMVVYNVDLFWANMNISELRGQKKVKIPLRSAEEIVDMRYMLMNRVSKEIVRPTLEQQRHVDDGNTLPINQIEYEQYTFVL